VARVDGPRRRTLLGLRLQWSTHALLRLLIDNGALDAGDFKRRAYPKEDRTLS
jgi:hypothetical protein